MKLPLLATALVFSAATASFALTTAEIAPAALKGKTLVFTVVNGGAPYATTGTWSGTFNAAGSGFTVKKLTGDTVNIVTSCNTGAVSGDFTTFTLAKFVEGRPAADLTLWVDGNGIGHYEVAINNVFGVGLNGTFKFDAVSKGPEIAIQQPVGTNLTDNKSKRSFGTVKVGKSRTKTFTIKNTGPATLSKLSVSVDGANKSSFIIGKPLKSSISKDGKTTFKVTFKPKTKGALSAAIHIKSNDANESPFDIRVAGQGTK